MDERRVGRRVEIDGEPVTWIVDPPGWKIWLTKEECEGRIVDLSVSGAGIVAPGDLGLEAGTIVGIRFRDHDGIVIVRRVAESDEEGQAYYGVMFHQLHPAVERWVHDTVGKLVHPEGDVLWNERRDE